MKFYYEFSDNLKYLNFLSRYDLENQKAFR